MLNNIKNRICKRKTSELKNSPGESVRDVIISAGIKSVQESGNKREIIRQFNQLPIQNQYELHLKNRKTKIVDKLTPLLIGKTKIMHFYEKL